MVLSCVEVLNLEFHEVTVLGIHLIHQVLIGLR
jgi:hypothetical protein